VVIKDLFNEKIKTFYQTFMSVSRARAKVRLLMDENSAKIIKKRKEHIIVLDNFPVVE
jgi:hypothetical protein